MGLVGGLVIGLVTGLPGGSGLEGSGDIMGVWGCVGEGVRRLGPLPPARHGEEEDGDGEEE